MGVIDPCTLAAFQSENDLFHPCEVSPQVLWTFLMIFDLDWCKKPFWEMNLRFGVW
ncbi:Protein of unknown function [Gryllus bimaculatus]|nr:Protein of unknown function [Gryllus bimaculatus]